MSPSAFSSTKSKPRFHRRFFCLFTQTWKVRKTNNVSYEFFLNSIPRENVEVCVCIATSCIKWTDVCVAVFVYLLRSCCPQKLFWLPAMLWHKLLLKSMEVFLVLVYSSNTGQLRHRHHGFIRASHPSCWRDMKNQLVQGSLNCFFTEKQGNSSSCYSRCARERLRGQRRTSERFSFCITPPLSAVLVTPSAVWTAWKQNQWRSGEQPHSAHPAACMHPYRQVKGRGRQSRTNA